MELKTTLVESLRLTFDAEYPNADFRGLLVDIEYPVDQQSYPSIWVDFIETDLLRRAGIDHHDTDEVTHLLTPWSRWRFAGTATFTVVALSSLERDRLFDEAVRVIAFGAEDPAVRQFREHLQTNPYIAVNGNFDTISVGGNAAAPGTPWGTDEIIYEKTISIDLLGEFVADRVTGTLTLLSAIVVDQPQVYADPAEIPPPNSAPSDGRGTWI